MAGTVVVDTIENGSGDQVPADDVIFGSARVWVNFNMQTSTIRTSYNASSVTDNGTGDFTINFTDPTDSADYFVCAMIMDSASGNRNDGGPKAGSLLTTSVGVINKTNDALSDGSEVGVAVFANP